MSKTVLNCRFINAQIMHVLHPATFQVPSQFELDALKPHDHVKVNHGKERFWVLVTQINGERITGVVDNDLINRHPFECGDTIQFKKCNAYAVILKPVI